MQRTDAVKWFWPFMLVASLAAGTIVALPPLAAAKADSAEPRFRMLVTVTARQSDLAEAGLPVAIEPACIVVKAKRPASMLDRFSALPKRES
ncbi:MAG TPA: hypothetical protein VFF44_04305 [Casimicrobiaceae bacterium]|nr:hypothetical protein [Casimicrobiaceae bacterium]